jgi:hypothetical protein
VPDFTGESYCLKIAGPFNSAVKNNIKRVGTDEKLSKLGTGAGKNKVQRARKALVTAFSAFGLGVQMSIKQL